MTTQPAKLLYSSVQCESAAADFLLALNLLRSTDDPHGALGLGLGGSKGSAAKGQFRKCGLTVVVQSSTQQTTRQGCATRLWNPPKHLLQIDPLPWTLNLLSAGSRWVADAALPTPARKGRETLDTGIIHIYIYIYMHIMYINLYNYT